jgi:hypothetical protein
MQLRWLILLLICITRPATAQPAPQPVDLLVDGGTAVTMDLQRHVFTDTAIAIRGDSIVAIGPRADMLARFLPARRLDAQASSSSRASSTVTITRR